MSDLIERLEELAANLDAVSHDDDAVLVREAAAALRAQQPQPIETAPRDGTPILGFFYAIRWADSHRKHDVVRCWWQPEFEAFISSCNEMAMHNGYAFEDGSTRRLHSPVIEPITHWFPLPTPPQEK